MTPQYPALAPGLTIAIPTYNRPEDLARTLDVIIPQVLENENVYLHVYDNCSPQVLPSFSDPRIVNHPRVKLVRNRYNEGIANFMRCYINCETEWIWVLGDDDLPSENAVKIIFSKVAPEYAYISFKIPAANILTKLDRDVSGKGLKEYFDQFDHRFMEMLCLSASIYHIPHIREYFTLAYTHLYSAAPHTLLAYMAIEKGASWMCSKDCIADYQVPDETQHWNRFVVFYGLPTFVPAFRLASSRRLMRDSIRKAWSSKPKKFVLNIKHQYGEEVGDMGELFSLFRRHYSPKFSEYPMKHLKWLILQFRLNFGGSRSKGL